MHELILETAFSRHRGLKTTFPMRCRGGGSMASARGAGFQHPLLSARPWTRPFPAASLGFLLHRLTVQSWDCAGSTDSPLCPDSAELLKVGCGQPSPEVFADSLWPAVGQPLSRPDFPRSCRNSWVRERPDGAARLPDPSTAPRQGDLGVLSFLSRAPGCKGT